MNKGSWGKLRAFFDLRTTDGFIIKGFKIVEGINGVFVGMPSVQNKEGEYYLGQGEKYDVLYPFMKNLFSDI